VCNYRKLVFEETTIKQIPRLPEGWESHERLPDRTVASELLAAAHPEPGPSVWKDPRVCLPLPYWRRALHAPVATLRLGLPHGQPEGLL
jgi:hypothetical protein